MITHISSLRPLLSCPPAIKVWVEELLLPKRILRTRYFMSIVSDTYGGIQVLSQENCRR
jgi:hypothetical protein